MNTLTTTISNYLSFCKTQKRLDEKTIKAYQIDLTQFSECFKTHDITDITVDSLETFIGLLHQTCKPKTVKRKIASVKAFFHYLEYKDLITVNPFNKIQIKFREPAILPKIIPFLFWRICFAPFTDSMNWQQPPIRRGKLCRTLPLLNSFSQRVSEFQSCVCSKHQMLICWTTQFLYSVRELRSAEFRLKMQMF